MYVIYAYSIQSLSTYASTKYWRQTLRSTLWFPVGQNLKGEQCSV